MSEPAEPRRKQGKVPAAIAAKLDNNQTVELDTADFDELGQTGELAGAPNATVAPGRTDREELDPRIGHAPAAEPKVVVALEDMPNSDTTLAELPQQRLGEIAGQRDIQTQYVGRISVERMIVPASVGRYRSLLIALYIVVATILAVSIYYRVA